MIDPRSVRAALRTVAALLLAALTGFIGARLHIPLAWMLGPLFAAALLSIAGADIAPHDNVRRIGQLSIGAAIGLNFSADALVELLRWFPLMVGSALFSVLVGALAARGLARYARIDGATAFFCCLPGGLAEMGNVGRSMGADPEPIAIVHTLRVTLIVMIVPPTLLMLGVPDFALARSAPVISWLWTVGLIAGGVFCAAALRMVHLNNPFMIGAILFAGAASASEHVSGQLDPRVFAVGQLLVGFAVGCRFRREMLARLPRVTVAAIGVVLALVLVMAAFGLAVAELTTLTRQDALLATSSGGLSEMAATAQVLHLAVPLVVGFQVTRGVLVNGLASHFYRLFQHIGLCGRAD